MAVKRKLNGADDVDPSLLASAPEPPPYMGASQDSGDSEGPGRGRGRSLGIPLTDDGKINWAHPKTKERVAQVLAEPGLTEKAGVSGADPSAPVFSPDDVIPYIGIIGHLQAGLAKTLLKCNSEVARCFLFEDDEARRLAKPGAELLSKYGPGVARFKPELEFLFVYSNIVAAQLEAARLKAEEIRTRPPEAQPMEKAERVQ